MQWCGNPRERLDGQPYASRQAFPSCLGFSACLSGSGRRCVAGQVFSRGGPEIEEFLLLLFPHFILEEQA